jgi:hypothetical protein
LATIFRRDREKQAHPGKHGGKRTGAGRPVGSHTHPKMTARALQSPDAIDARRAVIDAVTGSHRDPVLILLTIASDEENDPKLRVEAAGVAARYCYPALSATQITATHRTVDPNTALAVIKDRLDRIAAPVVDVEPEPQQTAVAAPESEERASDEQPALPLLKLVQQ